jgi:hypothetical protein
MKETPHYLLAVMVNVGWIQIQCKWDFYAKEGWLLYANRSSSLLLHS